MDRGIQYESINEAPEGRETVGGATAGAIPTDEGHRPISTSGAIAHVSGAPKQCQFDIARINFS